MSEYWVSKKKYFCKYCDIYIADDAPSRQHHESGMRHKGNVERYIRQIYKTGEKQKKDLEEEKREMRRIEQAANAAFAADVSSGVARAAAPPVASTSKPQKPVKPSNPYANYTTAASLGYTDPDAERIAAELERRRTQGVAGEWEVITPTEPVSTSQPTEGEQGEEEPNPLKREAVAPPDEEDTRSFKLRKKTVNTGLGEIYDPGLIPIKIKKKEPAETSLATAPADLSDQKPPLTSVPKWNPVQLKKTSNERVDSNPPTFATATIEPEASTSSNAASKWAKAQWSEPLEDLKEEDRPSIFKSVDGSAENPTASAPLAELKEEEDTKPDLNTLKEQSTSIVFKKRKAPTNSGTRGRRDA
ncbi:hypothetical protein CVT24_004551 [Panaeolus cyanescens]|uniref:Matrin-type domain-containing protein n=1 Tax=Panaeolus cyanescens TaxID=181874 RepID=A0A409VA32_9AGAR|nr:hypothetical protein CVT24_004551 [Panaeolus cyanescens]